MALKHLPAVAVAGLVVVAFLAPHDEPAPPADTPVSLTLTPSTFEVGTRFRVSSRTAIAQDDVGVRTVETVHHSEYEVEVTGVDGDRIEAHVRFNRDEIVTREGREVVQRETRPPWSLVVETTARKLLLLRAPTEKGFLLPVMPERTIRHGQRWTRTKPLVVAQFPLALEQTFEASTNDDGQAEVTLAARGSAPIGDTGVRLEIVATGRSLVDANACDRPLEMEATYRCLATGGPGFDSTSTVTVSITTSAS